MTTPLHPRLRFAPSPTGYLHVGGARTALYNWLYARKVGGTFLLRVEDTDKQRSSDEHTRIILDGLTWLGLNWDEEIVFQGARVARHQDVADQLLAGGRAYMEDGAIRFRMSQGEIAWDDFVHGRISFQGSEIKDWVILRSDRTPTYNFSVVVDDIDMRITHVMRGDDHISNTPKQIEVYRALGAALPAFGHVPMIHGMDGKKLSKRHGATAVGDYQHMGILPGAMRNFLALLGWSPGNDRELFFDLDEMVQAFSIEALQVKAAIFDPRKLEWMNGQHLSRTPAEQVLEIISPMLRDGGLDLSRVPPGRVLRCIEVVRERSRTTHDVVQQVLVRLKSLTLEPDDKAKKFIAGAGPTYHASLVEAASAIGGMDTIDEQTTDQLLSEAASRAGVSRNDLFQSVRVGLTGGIKSEPVTVLVPLIGTRESARRLEHAKTWR
jgi:glutamyl-tRNA synthetase